MKPLLDPIKTPPKSRSFREKAFKNAQRRASTTRNKAAPFLELYQNENSPSSHAVRNRLSALGLDYIAHQGLPKQVGGGNQIPFLIDHKSGVHLSETTAILRYLSNEYDQPGRSLLARVAQRLNTEFQSGADRIAWIVNGPMRTAVDIGQEALAAWTTVKEAARDASKRARRAPKSSAA